MLFCPCNAPWTLGALSRSLTQGAGSLIAAFTALLFNLVWIPYQPITLTIMEAKKNIRKQIGRNSGLFFTMGVTMVLLLVHLALQWKTHPSESQWATAHMDPDLILEVEPPITRLKMPEPPKPLVTAPPIIEVVEDDKEIVETLTAPTDTDWNQEIAPIGEIGMDSEEPMESIPFVLIENAPLFPGCEKEETEKDKRECFQQMLQQHIQRHFQYPELARELGLEGKVNVMFTILEDGSIAAVMMRGPHESLEAESARILSKLPKMQPGLQRGRAVKVTYAIPITFKLQ